MAIESSSGSKSGGTDSWLVKAGDRILGPFSTEAVEKMVTSRELVILDEVSPPEGRWRFIRDVSVFRSAVEEARKTIMNAREETEIGGIENTESSTMPTFADNSFQEMSSKSDSSSIRDADFEDVPSPFTPRKPKQFGIRSAAPSANERSPQSIIMWTAAAIVVICAGYMILSMRKPTAQRGVASLDFDRAFVSAERAWRRGDFTTAERLYMQANRQKPNQPAIVAKLAPLMIQLDGATVEAKRLLAESKAATEKTADREVLTNLSLSTALAAMYSGDFDSAAKLYEKASTDSAARSIAQFNLGMIAYLRGDFELALPRFSAAGTLPVVKFMAARTLASMPKRRGGRKEAASILLSLTKNEFDFYQEGQLLSALLLLESGNRTAAESRMKMVIEADPDMTTNHWHDPLLFQSETAWRSLVSVCEKLNTGVKSDVSRGLLAFCFAKAGQIEKATTTLNAGLSTNNENQMFQSINAFIQYSSNREADARAALRLAMNQPPVPVLARILKARSCFYDNEFDCAESHWSPLAQASGAERLAGVTGLAQIAERRGQKEKAKEIATKASALSPKYKPAMRLLEGEGV